MTALVFVTGASTGLGLALARSVPFQARVVDVSRSGPPDGSGLGHFPADLARPEFWAVVGGEIRRLVDEHDPNRAVLIHAAESFSPSNVESITVTIFRLASSTTTRTITHSSSVSSKI
jgi:NAD(P)-dependent dehydrogenase (short-subunit alcohol dehydrogenase family)